MRSITPNTTKFVIGPCGEFQYCYRDLLMGLTKATGRLTNRRVNEMFICICIANLEQILSCLKVFLR